MAFIAITTEETCPIEDCDGTITDADEISGAHPWGTGYIIRMCDTCGHVIEGEERWVGH